MAFFPQNIPELAVTLVVFILFLWRGVRIGKALAYCCFLFVGATIARLQWLIVGEQDPSGVSWYIFFAVVQVGALSVIAFVASFSILKEEKPLIVIFALTVGLAILQFSGVWYQLLNWYARFYALACVLIPFLVLAKSWSGPDPPRD
jgi:fucose 4-O-acetylase-like acetyltransferase